MSYINKEYWEKFYKNNTSLNDASTFSEYILNQIIEKQSELMIVDLGCGTGKDTFNFAKSGFEVIGVDGSEEVIKMNNSKINSLDIVEKNIDFYCVDLSESNKVSDLMSKFNTYSKLKGKKILFYTRFFLHAIPEDVEDILLNNIISNVKVPFTFVSEFRTKEDELLDKIFQDHYRRYVDTDKLLKKLLAYGFSIQTFIKGRGYSIYKNENPYVARFVIYKH